MMERKQVLFATLFLTKFNSTIHEEIFIFDEEPNIFPDADAPRWMKVLGILIYLLNFPAIMVILAFVHFETQGFAGHFRTIINQLVSCINMLGVFYIIFSSPIDLIRIIYGPLGLEVCEINRMMKIMIPLIIIFLCNAIAFWKFIFICVWKSYRTINDSFLTFFTIISATFVTFLLGLSVVSGPGKPPMYKIVCTGVFKNSDNLLGPKFIGIDIAQSTGFLAYIGFLLPVWISKRKIKTEEKINVFHQRPKELVNHSTNIFALVMIGSASFANFKINMISPDQFDKESGWFYPFYSFLFVPCLTINFIAMKILIKHGKDIDRELFNSLFQNMRK